MDEPIYGSKWADTVRDVVRAVAVEVEPARDRSAKAGLAAVRGQRDGQREHAASAGRSDARTRQHGDAARELVVDAWRTDRGQLLSMFDDFPHMMD